MDTAIFLNGVFEATLTEILAAQKSTPEVACMVQPYKPERIKLLADKPVTAAHPRRIYLSVTTSLGQVSYRANVVDWKDKRLLQPSELAELNRRIAAHQPKEKEVYLEVAGKPCVNLIFVTQMEKLASPLPVSCFVKITDNVPLKPRTQAGGWAYVYAQPEWMGVLPTLADHDLTAEIQDKVKVAAASSSEERAARLASAPKKPEQIQVVARAFRRNADVMVEVLLRAAGKCECCKSFAPFMRASDGSPYLEVHHRIPLAAGGDDTVANSLALCPNCHRERHFGNPSATKVLHQASAIAPLKEEDLAGGEG